MATGLRASSWTQSRPATPAPTTTTRSLSGPAIGVSFDHVSRPAGSGGGPGTAGKGREGEGRAGAAPPGGPSCRPMTADLAPTTPEARVAPSSVAPRTLAAIRWVALGGQVVTLLAIGRASCRERVCQYV